MSASGDASDGEHRSPKPVSQSNWRMVAWMIGLGLKQPIRCVGLLLLHSAMLGLALGGLGFAGMAVDALRKAVQPDAPLPRGPLGFTFPLHWAPMRVIAILALAIIVMAAFRGGLRYLTGLTQARLVQTIVAQMRQQVYDKLQRLSFRFFDFNQTGSIINRATGDVNSIAAFAELAIIQVAILIITLVINFAYMWSIHPVLTLVSMIPVPIMFAGSIAFARLVRPAYEENRRLYDRLILILSENAQGQHVVKGFGLEQREMDKFRTQNDAFRAQQRWLFKRSAAYSSGMHALSQVSLMIVLGYGGYLAIQQRADPDPAITVGRLIVFAGLLNQFSAQVLTMAGMANVVQASLTAAARVREVFETPLEIDSRPDAVSRPRLQGGVEFQNVTFAYKAGEPVLRDVSFKVEPGQCVAILGATGSGKSTLLSLISRFYDPSQGRVLIDGIDARDLNLDHLRKNIGLVFQENFLFSNTIRNNIAFGQPQASLEQIQKAARIAAADGFINELPEKYDTVIGEFGSTLSGGQRQRLAIARAILLEPSILILDDATAAIDPETEHEILQAMDNAMRGRTTFVVAHRLSTLRRADFVIVLEQGRIVQVGTHEQLMSAQGQYRNVARLQVVDDESLWIIRARQWMDGEVDSPILDTADNP